MRKRRRKMTTDDLAGNFMNGRQIILSENLCFMLLLISLVFYAF
jgi:hypothetical protein